MNYMLKKKTKIQSPPTLPTPPTPQNQDTWKAKDSERYELGERFGNLTELVSDKLVWKGVELVLEKVGEKR